MKIKLFLKKDTNNYIVMPKIQKFLKENNLGSADFRGQGLNKIEDFSNTSDEAKEKVNIWIDQCTREGIKHLYFTKVSFNKDDTLYKSELFWKEFSHKHNIQNDIHINEYTDDNILDYKGISINKDSGSISNICIVMSFSYLDATNSHEHPVKESYPIFAELDIKKRILIVRLKSKNKIYVYTTDENGINNINYDKKISCDKIINKIIKKLSLDIGFTQMDEGQICNEIEEAYYKILDEITKTPDIIKQKIVEFKDVNINYIKNMLANTQIPESKYFNLIQSDLNILLEKFISVSYPDKEIFKDSYAFPIKLVATDSEDTKVEETASGYQPLQTKAAFYDHKKIISEEKRCEGMTLAAYRKNSIYYGKTPFTIRCDLLKTKGMGRLRFLEYVEEEDIQNVLSRIVSIL